MFKKRCILKNEELTSIYDTDSGKYIGFSYNATIVADQKNNVILTLHSTVEMTGINFIPNNFLLFLDDSTTDNDTMVLSSRYFKEQDSMFLKLIEIQNVSLRNRGLGSIILAAWLRLLPTYSMLYNISFSKITGSVGKGSNFTPKAAEKLYRKFNNYKYDQTQYLKLNKSALKHGQLEYILE